MNIGDTINGYTIISVVGDGGFGIVYQVEKNGQHFAMKTLLQNVTPDTEIRFRREMRMLEKVKSENVIEMIEFSLNNPLYYIMPLCSDSLSDRVKAGMSNEEKIDACISFCEGVKALHDAGIFHRDIKPDNAMFFDNVLKITDLGIGRFENRDTKTVTRLAIGTEGYYPPEYLKDPDTFVRGTRQGDVYMLGKSLYYVMSNGGDVTNVDFSQVEAGVAPIIERCLKTNLNERYNNVDEILEDISAYRSVYKQLQQMPKTFDEINGIHGDAKYDELYKLLVQESQDEQALAVLLEKIDDATFKKLFTVKKDQLNNYIGVFDYLLRNPRGRIQFANVEIYVSAIKMMFSLCNSAYNKQKLFDLAFDLAIQYNRYPAMLIIGDILSSLSDADARALSIFFMRRKDDILHMKPNFKHPVHYLINNLISSTRTIS